MLTIINKCSQPTYGRNAFKGDWREKERSNGKVMMENRDGKKKIVPIDKEGIKKGWYLQSGNSADRDAFIETYGYYPQASSEEVKKYLSKKGLLHKWRPDNPNNPDYVKPPAPLKSEDITSIDQL